MIIYKHAFFIKILFEINGGQLAQQELPLGIKKNDVGSIALLKAKLAM
jgi:hypothetical protein